MNRGLSEKQAFETHAHLERVLYELKKVIVGQDALLERLLVSLICGGHVLVEGAPGLAKTLTLNCLSRVLSLDFQRIQFTPDLLPSDLIGTRIYNPAQAYFQTEKGPLFSNFILADEINRAPAKVQSALLEAMQEKQVTIGRDTFPLPNPFLVMATQNPLELEGTYLLPEAQLDRFLFKLLVPYPSVWEEAAIIRRMTGEEPISEIEALLNAEALIHIQEHVRAVYLDPALIQFIAEFVSSTRQVASSELRFAASPRASLSLAISSRALALLKGRTYVIAQDIHAVLFDCLRHRIQLSYEALSMGKTVESILESLLEKTPLPVLGNPAPDSTSSSSSASEG
jgi:MoxR-like ATPase